MNQALNSSRVMSLVLDNYLSVCLRNTSTPPLRFWSTEISQTRTYNSKAPSRHQENGSSQITNKEEEKEVKVANMYPSTEPLPKSGKSSIPSIAPYLFLKGLTRSRLRHRHLLRVILLVRVSASVAHACA